MQKTTKLQLVMRLLSMAYGLYFCLIVCLTVLRPLYLPFLNADIKLRLVCAGEKNEEALANNVRINHISVNGKDINLATVKPNANSLWRYDSENDFLYCYDAKVADEIIISIEGVHSLKVGAVGEIGSGILEMYLNDKLWKSVDLYRASDWENITFGFETSRWVFPERSILFQLTGFGISLAFCLLIAVSKNKNFEERVVLILNRFLQAGLLAAFILIAVSLMQYGSLADFFNRVQRESQSFLKAWCFFFLCMLAMTIITERPWIAMMVVGIFAILGSFASNQKLLNREVPFLPWDITYLNEAASIVKKYELSVRTLDVLVFLSIIVISLILFHLSKRRKFKFSGFERVIDTIIISVIIVFFLRTSFLDYQVEANDVDYRVYQVNNYYLERGFTSAFLEYCTYLYPSQKPEDYSKKRMEALVRKIEDQPSETSDECPTIIAIMSESFWDISRLKTISFKSEVLPVYDALSKEGMSGELFTHVLNGGTVTSEFEFLTGFSGEFFPLDYMVYGNFLKEGFSSAVEILEKQGYQTTAIHPFVASNYNRETAYQNLGFDECLFEEDFHDYNKVRNYISDADLFERIEEEFEEKKTSGKPQFIFSVTMQNHGGYWEDTIYEKAIVPFETDEYGSVAKGSISDYVAGLHESDRALGELINFFDRENEDVIIIFFGDHMSDAGPKDDRLFQKAGWDTDDLTYDYETHRVPFLVWSNYDNKYENYGLMEVGELFPAVFERFHIRSNLFWNYLQRTRDVYKASDQRIIVNADNDYQSISEMKHEQEEVYRAYQLLQYDYIWGERYAGELWDKIQ